MVCISLWIRDVWLVNNVYVLPEGVSKISQQLLSGLEVEVDHQLAADRVYINLKPLKTSRRDFKGPLKIRLDYLRGLKKLTPLIRIHKITRRDFRSPRKWRFYDTLKSRKDFLGYQKSRRENFYILCYSLIDSVLLQLKYLWYSPFHLFAVSYKLLLGS